MSFSSLAIYECNNSVLFDIMIDKPGSPCYARSSILVIANLNKSALKCRKNSKTCRLNTSFVYIVRSLSVMTSRWNLDGNSLARGTNAATP